MAGTSSSGRVPVALLRTGMFRTYWAGGFLTQAGTWAHNITASVLMLSLTGSPFMVGLLGFVTFLPMFLFSLFGGVIADRYPRERIVVAASVVQSCGSAMVLASLIIGRGQIATLLAAGFTLMTANAFARPSVVSLLPALVPREQLSQATALNSTQFMAAQAAGAAVSSAVLLIAMPELAFVVSALARLAMIVAMVRIMRSAVDTSVDQAASRKIKGLTAGMRYVFAHPTMRVILGCVVVIGAVPEVVRTLAPSMTVDVFSMDEASVGVLVSGHSFGSGTALVLVSMLVGVVGARRLAFTGVATQMLGLSMIALAPNFWVAVAGTYINGVGFSLSFPLLSARLQEVTPDEIRGRVMSMHTISHMGVRPFAAIAAGALGTVIGERITVALTAATVPFALLGLRRVMATKPDQGDEPSQQEGGPVPTTP